MSADWDEVAVAVRSRTHYATWIGHMQGTDLDNTPAGPQRLVKAALVVMLPHGVRAYRWRRVDADCCALEVQW